MVRKFSLAGANEKSTSAQCNGASLTMENKNASTSGVTCNASDSEKSNDHILTLMHLRKVLNELLRSANSSEDRDRKLYPVIRLFMKVCKVFTVEEITNRFKEAAQFVSLISNFLVQEIRIRAACPSTALPLTTLETALSVEAVCLLASGNRIEAAVEIVAYLKPTSDCSETKVSGWSMLYSLSFLLSSNKNCIVESACKTSLPSTLVKSLYLFCDLPKTCPLDEDQVRTLRGTLMKTMTAMLKNPRGIEQMASKDDLVLLFCGVSSWCPVFNHTWRNCSAELLMTISSGVRSLLLINYIHTHKCIELFVDNLKHSTQESIPDMVEMICCLLCILKDFASVSSILLDDFENADGYKFLSDLVLQYENVQGQNEQDSLRNLLFLVNSVVSAGCDEIKLPEVQNPWKTSRTFHMPQPLGEGRTVRNMKAFELLEAVFIHSRQTYICCTILDVLYSMLTADPVNYFILENRCPLGKFLETLSTKSLKVQRKLFDLIEYVVFQLNYLPSKEFIAIGPVLKMNKLYRGSLDMASIHLILGSLFKILTYSPAVKDVFREVGLLDVFITVLQNVYTSVKSENEPNEQLWDTFTLTINTLCLLVKQCNANVVLVREIGGTKTVFTMVEDDRCRPLALKLLQHIMMNPSGEDELAGVLALLHSPTDNPISLKSDVLQFLSFVLRESHRVRMAFRRVGGYVYLLSLILNMSGSFKNLNKDFQQSDSFFENFAYLRNIFKVLTMSMRFEPSNAMFFQNEVKFNSLTDSLHLLGCFSEKRSFSVIPVKKGIAELRVDFLSTLCDIFNVAADEKLSFPKGDLSENVVVICAVLRLLYDMAFDRSDRTGKVIEFSSEQPAHSPNMISYRFASLIGQNAFVVHTGAVMCMFELLLYVEQPNPMETLNIQLFIIEIVKSILRTERNQQVMCCVGLPRLLFDTVSDVFFEEEHPLLPPSYYILERLAAQGMTPNELRSFLRLDKPWCCADLDSDEPCGSNVVALNRVKTLVSMMTPKDLRLSLLNASPPFVEFDMSIEGFGCIFLPSIAPVGFGFVTGGLPLMHSNSQDATVMNRGGLGNGERIFPPLAGLTYLCWVYVERFSESGAEAHPLRLLTVYRTLASSHSHVGQSCHQSRSLEASTPPTMQGSSEIACLQMQISPVDRSLIIATYETDTPGADLDKDVGNADGFVRVGIEELRRDRQWNHLAVVLNRSVLKSSTVTVYVNGQQKASQRIQYVSHWPTMGTGAVASSLTTPQTCTVNALIGTAPGPFRKQSSLLWRLSGAYLIEEAMSPQAVGQAYELGPHYTGSFQSPSSFLGCPMASLVTEERVSFGLHATAMSTMTLARLRKIYNKQDSRAIGKLLGISSHENITPVRLMHNSTVHLSGPARTLGGVLVGYLGMRTFCAKSSAKLLETVGGIACVLGLVSMADDTESLYAAIKALFFALKTNRALNSEMEKIHGYQILTVLLKEKSRFLNTHVLYLLFSMVGTLDVTRETVVIPNTQAFEDLFCDLQVWNDASVDLQRLLYEHFYQLITESGSHEENLAIVRHVGLLPRLLYTLAHQPHLLKATKDVIFNLISAILQPIADYTSVLKFGQFIIATLQIKETSNIEKSLPNDIQDLQALLFNEDAETEVDAATMRIAYLVYIRNRCLNILLNMLLNTSGKLNFQLCEQICKVLGFDWILALFNASNHKGTVRAGLQILLTIAKHSTLLNRFKEGVGNGGWLTDAESVVQNRAGVLLGFSVSARGSSVGSSCDLNLEICNLAGFVALQHLLPCHASLAETQIACASLLVGHSARHLPTVHAVDVESIWSLIFNNAGEQAVVTGAMSKLDLCPEASLPLLSVVRACVASNEFTRAECSEQNAVTLVQFVAFLYRNNSEFSNYAQTSDFVVALASTLLRPNSKCRNNTSEEETLQWTLPNHPAVRHVLELLSSIAIDGFLSGQPNKHESVIDILLGPIQQNTNTMEEFRPLVTAFLLNTMDRLEATDVLARGVGVPMSSPAAPCTNYSILAANIFYFTGKVVYCLWNDLFDGDPQSVFEFILKLFAQVKRKSGPGVPLDALYSSWNRCILFLLSRVLDDMKAQRTVIECLQKITANRALLFSSANGEPEFFCCLAHLLFMLSDVGGLQAPHKLDSEIETEKEEIEQRRLYDGRKLVSANAKRVWEELFLAKKQLLEETLAVTIMPDVGASRAFASAAASQQWLNFVDNEMKGCYGAKDALQIHLQLQSKLHMVTGGLQRLASKKNIKTTGTGRQTIVSKQEFLMWLKVHVTLIHELFDLQYTRYLQWHEHTKKWCLDEWTNLKQELTRERGLWGPKNPSVLNKYMLDSTEGPCRMRMKMIPNISFYVDYPYRPNVMNLENKTTKNKLPCSCDSQLYYERVKTRHGSCFDPRIIDLSQPNSSKLEEGVQFDDAIVDVNAQMIKNTIKRSATSVSSADGERDEANGGTASSSDEPNSINDDVVVDDTASSSVFSDSPQARPRECTSFSTLCSSSSVASEQPERLFLPKEPDSQTLLRLLEEGEELNSMYRCARICGLDSSEGLLLFGKYHYYVIDGFTLLKTREIRDLDFLPEELHDPIVPYIASGATRNRSQKRLCSKFAYEDIRECHKRRYLLQPIAIEVFSSDGRNHLLAFPRKIRDKIYAKLLACAKSLTGAGHQSVSGQKSGVDVEQGAGLLAVLMGETSVTQRWVRGEISNFQYLMHLNTLAGRSYNDLSQYPVFPWILSDYDSEELDLTNPNTFRDLSKPMGAQTPARLEQFLKRFREWDDPSGETPPYMYGTHYSSAMIVVSYLVRVEPFTQQFLKLQGGHFDLADRMFHSVKDAWLSASRNNMADVKELVPEFFYLPNFLLNSNHFELGVKQSGLRLGDVILPPWAKGDAREFVRLHRQALESDYVSAHLNQWIDLIFGYRQQGQAAVDAFNLFHHLFYEANVNFEAIEDPLTKNATIGFINNFGQIPSQLFKKPHPVKRSLKSTLPLLQHSISSSSAACTLAQQGVEGPTAAGPLFYHVAENLKPPLQPVRELKQAVGHMAQNDKGTLLAVEQNKVLVPPQFHRYLAWGFPDNSIRLGSSDFDKSVCIHESPHWGDVICASCPNAHTAVTGSTCSVVCVWEIVGAASRNQPAHLELRKRLYGHTEPVSCIYASTNFGVIVSGSRDRTCIVWDLSKLSFIRQLGPHAGPVSAVSVNEATGVIASCSGTHLHLWSFDGQKLAWVNTADGCKKSDINEIIIAITFSVLNEWDSQHVIAVGTNTGIVKLWTVKFVKVFDECNHGGRRIISSKASSRSYSALFAVEPECDSYCDTMDHVAVEAVNTYPNNDHCDNGLTMDKVSFTLGNNSHSSEDDEQDSDAVFDESVSNVLPTSSCAEEQSGNDEMDIRRRSSESTMQKSSEGTNFCADELQRKFHWERQLVFRGKLTMHTAFERKDNPTPAAVTALMPSKDHKALYVGDGRGRVWMWTIGDGHIGGRADHWVQDPSRNLCSNCHQKFTLTDRRHHCRNCGQLFCSKCSRFESEIRHLRIRRPVRVCQSCHARLKAIDDCQSTNHATYQGNG
ncbi:WD repeat and FYVE domain-containing protein 3 [Trichinella zimbabwensis]|uniref:WD repeat and FYVE domain-containing protein 3 n=1 Tax=Trichinella zimbabwensis TaxID=268475 RepID=A0A0V1HZT2_9BILA|nr:WD repeat and FYVE domain-containing protein 3 [Trichinella zimbabwensis]